MARDQRIRAWNAPGGPNYPQLLRYLDTNGDGTGTKNANGDYSLAQEIFFIQPPVNQIFSIRRMLIQIADTGSVDAGSYGNGITLTNGIEARVQDDSGTISDLTDQVPILTNADWARQCYDATNTDFGAGQNYISVRWTFANGGKPIVLNGNSNERLEVLLEDDLDGLTGHYFLAHGFLIDNT